MQAGPTLVDVARRAGVSIATVSNLLNGRASRMRAETRLRVEGAIVALGYQPNRAARLLRTGQAQMIGLLVPSISNGSYAALAREIEIAAREAHDHRLIVSYTYRNPELERSLLDDLLSHGVRGAIVVSASGLQDAAGLAGRGLVAVGYDNHAEAGMPLVIDHVSVDHAAAAALAVEHLTANGHRSLAFLSPAGRTLSRAAKIQGLQEAARRAGARAAVLEGQGSSAFGDNELAEIGEALAAWVVAHPDHPTGLVTVNDMVAIGLLAGLQKARLCCPEEFSVIGMDALPLTAYTSPALTSVSSPLKEMARLMVERIAQRTADPALSAGEFVLSPSLVVRASVTRAPMPKGERP
ncbi:LacI family DNA-binding transcriptional regulator [Roseomonas sp. GCM10028921]